MSHIIELTAEQQKSISDIWQQEGLPDYAMLAQPQWKKGRWILKVAMLGNVEAEEIEQVLKKHAEEDI